MKCERCGKVTATGDFHTCTPTYTDSLLERILECIEYIEKKFNQCDVCGGVGSRRIYQVDELCYSCNGKGYK
jgi:hypothetical protein